MFVLFDFLVELHDYEGRFLLKGFSVTELECIRPGFCWNFTESSSFPNSREWVNWVPQKRVTQLGQDPTENKAPNGPVIMIVMLGFLKYLGLILDKREDKI